jgi:2-keto-4-pentenoate hydratase/2-oxohepta-3-ene-1,7-dioic acid hydratase in catechol pathway
MSYGPNTTEPYVRAAEYVDRILEGEKLPISQFTSLSRGRGGCGQDDMAQRRQRRLPLALRHHGNGKRELEGKLADAAAKGQGNGWLNTKMFDETDAVKSQGWTALILDTNGNGKRELEGKLADAAAKGQGKPVSQVRFRPPLPRPENIICMAVNYMEDGTLAEPAPINAFMKSPSAIIGDGDAMVLPDMAATIFEGEAELAVVIGKRASHVKATDAHSRNGWWASSVE